MATKAERAQATADRDRAIESLRERFPVGASVSTFVTHVSSASSRVIAVFAPAQDGSGAVEDISWQVARALERKLHRTHSGMVVHGGGMDMAFSVVYDLSHTLHGDGYALKYRRI